MPYTPAALRLIANELTEYVGKLHAVATTMDVHGIKEVEPRLTNKVPVGKAMRSIRELAEKAIQEARRG